MPTTTTTVPTVTVECHGTTTTVPSSRRAAITRARAIAYRCSAVATIYVDGIARYNVDPLGMMRPAGRGAYTWML
jgi:hypothetical protein